MSRFLIVALLACGGSPRPDIQPPAPPAATPTRPAEIGSLRGTVPTAWRSIPPSSAMRQAQWELPGADGAEPGELVVYHFGAGGAGNVEANLERWYTQFAQPDGRPTRELAKTEAREVEGMTVTLVEVGGRYVAETSPGSGERVDHAGWQMIAAIVEAPDGAYYFKAVGPAATIARWREALVEMVGSLRHGGGHAHGG